MRIGELSKLSGATIATIRFYEEKGLLLPDSRSEGGFREYVSDDVETVKTILAIKQLGFSLSEIRNILSVTQSHSAPNEIAAIVNVRLKALQAELDTFQSMKSILDSILVKLANGNLPADKVLGVFSEE